MTWPEGSEDPEGKASERNPDVVRSAHRTQKCVFLQKSGLFLVTT